MKTLFIVTVVLALFMFMNGDQENICLKDKDALQCNEKGLCQCCLTNGTAATAELTDKLKSCDCLVKLFQSKEFPAMGRFTPKCEEDGSYSPMQVHWSTGLSWCAEPTTGNNITDKGRTLKGCKCVVDGFLAEEKNAPGRYTPKCEADGTFAKLQTHGSTGMSWCVEPLTGTNVSEKARGKYKACDCLVENHLNKEKPAAGRYSPKCEDDGTYSAMQTHSSIGMSWCVDPISGENITEKARGVYKACQCIVQKKQAEADKENKIGKFVPKCETNGTYSAKQTHSSTGKSWCADPETGDRLMEVGRGEDLFCNCIVEKTVTQKTNAMGAFTPSCEANGSFSKKQSHPSTGMSWCVDPQTGQNTTAPDREDVKCE